MTSTSANRLRRGLRAVLLATAVLCAVVAPGCGATKPAITASAEGVDPAAVVIATDNRFEPQRVRVRVGEAVTWEFRGGAKHDVVAADGLFVSELMRSGSFTHVFTEPGTFMYDCSIHPEMIGTVEVVE